MTEPALLLADVTKAYGHKPVLHGVSFRLERGETVGFVGPNGAGKTTCLRLLVGLTFRNGGTARVLGLDPTESSLAIRRRCCYLPGETSLYHNLTGHEVLQFALGFYPRLDDSLRERLAVEFELPLDAKVREYSAGMKQKLALIATLVPDVDLYLLDEPDRNLDPAARLVLRDAVANLGVRQKTVLFSSHHLGEVGAIASRQVFMMDGRIVDDELVQAARAGLRGIVRLRLVGDAGPPAGAEIVSHEPDGTWRVRPDEEPLQWIARLDPALVQTAEVGATRLDDIYRALTGSAEQPHGAP